MNAHYLDETIQVFDSLPKWDAFLELNSLLRSDVLVKHWLAKGAETLKAHFDNNPSTGWRVETWDNTYEVRWYLDEFGDNSIGVGFGYPTWDFLLHIKGRGKFDQAKAVELLESADFRKLREIFPLDVSKDGCFGFLAFNPYSAKTGDERKFELVWYASHDPQGFANRMAKLVHRITEDNEMVGLMRRLNFESRV